MNLAVTPFLAAAAAVAGGLGLLAGPRIAWAIRAWPGHEEFHCDYLACHACAGGLRRGCYNAGIAQDRLYALFSALLAAVSVIAFGLGTKAVLSWVFGVACLIITIVDVRFYIIPDRLSIHGFYAGLLYTGAWSLAIRAGAAPPQHYVPFTDSLLGFLLGGGFLGALGWIAWFILKKEGMGGGDVKLLAAVGAWMGWQPVIATIVLASFGGSLVGISTILWRRLRHGTAYQPLQHMIPFGPYLCLGFLFVFYFGMDPLFRLVEIYQAWVESRLLSSP
ncbi:MAG: prepilin peptidase [Candidatus Riflebacteria bacterium]|nr:prepilin peptidase [Candidatus Riflebacteria bacterium]